MLLPQQRAACKTPSGVVTYGKSWTYYNVFCIDCLKDFYNRTGNRDKCRYCGSDNTKVAKDL